MRLNIIIKNRVLFAMLQKLYYVVCFILYSFFYYCLIYFKLYLHLCTQLAYCSQLPLVTHNPHRLSLAYTFRNAGH